MMSSLEKFGRKFTMYKTDGKEKRNHHLDELAQASKDMQDIRNCYDGLLSAAAAMTNSIFEFSESLQEVGTCLLEKTVTDADGECGRVLSTLGNIQSELRKIADIYRSYVIVTITTPSESLLSELQKVEAMKLQCDEKREAYQNMMSQQKEKGKLRNGKAEASAAQKLQEAHDEYNEVARLCVFRVKSLKEGQLRILLTQATRHHAAQMDFFRKGFKALEAVDPVIRIVAEKHRIDYQLSELDNGTSGVSEDTSSYEIVDDGELSFDYRHKKQGLDNVATSSYQVEENKADIPHLQVPTLGDPEMNHYKHQGETPFGMQARVSSYSAPLYPEKINSSEKQKESQTPKKYHSYVLPSPVDPKSPNSKSPTPVPYTNPFSKLQKPPTVDHENHERGFGNDNTSTSVSTSTQLPTPSHSGFDSKLAKRQAYSGPLLPSKPFSGKLASTSGPISGKIASTSGPISGKIASTSGPISGTELPHNVPSPLSSPKISELHELPRPPGGLQFSKPVVSPGGVTGAYSGPIATRLPPPPLVVPRSFSVHSTNRSPRITGGRPQEVFSPPLTPISLLNMKSVNRI
ncbi:uncharacterized protein At2g33490 isoform X2 [Helianthus annuus]|uniref:uncharacterized protein At2g33490 isoform X2 n=1 Tax=Helianthus annuus TaxID=4232 RepID=UPI000B8EEA0B|nr:uncharacterized protein At2g33490 isoform X2 [Helianthus annuus]